jgi:hypothetical protein
MAMYGEKTDRTLDYASLRREIIEEAEQLNRINLATAYNNQVHAFYPLCVFIDLNAYIVLTEQFIWVKEIQRNPNVVLNTYNKQFYGTAKILGDPYDDKYWRIRMRFKKKHRIMWDRCINIPKTTLIEVKVNQVTIMDYQNDYVPYWKVTHIDAMKGEAYWNYIFEEPPYWLQITESKPELIINEHTSEQVMEEQTKGK